MAANGSYFLRVRVRTPDVEPLFCVIVFDVDAARKAVKVQSAAGRAEDFRTLRLDATPAEVTAWFESLKYYARIDPRITVDLERFTKRLAADAAFVASMMKAVADSDMAPIDYALSAELEHILGSKHLARETQFGQASATSEAPAPTARPLLMNFLMAPLNGVPLVRLGLHQRVMARFSDLKDARTRAFLETLPDEERKPALEVVVKSLREARDVGPDAVRAVVQLPGGVEAEVVEENRYIRVRLADGQLGGESQRGSQRPVDTAVTFSGLEVPAWAVFASAMFVMVILATVLFSLL